MGVVLVGRVVAVDGTTVVPGDAATVVPATLVVAVEACAPTAKPRKLPADGATKSPTVVEGGAGAMVVLPTTTVCDPVPPMVTTVDRGGATVVPLAPFTVVVDPPFTVVVLPPLTDGAMGAIC